MSSNGSSGGHRLRRVDVQRRRMRILILLLAAACVGAVLFLGYRYLSEQKAAPGTSLAAGSGRAEKNADANSLSGAGSTAVQGQTGTREADSSAEDVDALHLGETSDSARGIVSYKGKKYRYNEHLSNYLFLGIDTTADISNMTQTAKAGQSDAIFLIAFDRKEDTLSILAIPRDTMTDIAIYSDGGTYFGTTVDHLALQYAYGDGRFTSCELTRDAVSHLFYSIPIVGYASMDRAAIPVLADVVDGVPLTVPDNSLAEKDSGFQAGAGVTITSENADLFLHYRDISLHQQALVRMDRQKVFIRAFADRLMELQKQNPHTITDVYEKMKQHMVTNMTNDVFLDLAGARREGGIVTIPGKGVATEKYDEYHVDEDALYELVLDVFYREVVES